MHPIRSSEKLRLFKDENYIDTLCYRVLLLDNPYNHTYKSTTNWVDKMIVSDSQILSLEYTVFEALFLPMFTHFKAFDAHTITDFSGDDLFALKKLLKEERNEIDILSKSDFLKKYEWIIEFMRDVDSFKLRCNVNQEFKILLVEIYTIFDILLTHIDIAIEEKMAITIVGI